MRLIEADVKFGAPHLLRQHLGLTQVSRTVRNEFSPIYSQSYKHEILFGDLPAYLASYPLADTDMMQTMVELVVGLRHKILKQSGLDIMPIITLDWHALPFQVAWASEWPVHGQSVLYRNLAYIEHVFRRIVQERVLESYPIGLDGALPEMRLIESSKIEKQVALSTLPKLNVVVRLNLDKFPISFSDASTATRQWWAAAMFFYRIFLYTPLQPKFMFRVGGRCLPFENLLGRR